MNEGPPSSIPVWKEGSHVVEHFVPGSARSELVFAVLFELQVGF
jgi:hypothetical protein